MTSKTHSLVWRLRILLGLCFGVSLVALLVKAHFLSLTERRAMDIVQRSAPVIEAAHTVPERMRDLDITLSQVLVAEDKSDLAELRLHIKVLNDTSGAPFDMVSDELLTVLVELVDLQSAIVSERRTIQQMLRAESLRLDNLDWILGLEQAALAKRMAELDGRQDQGTQRALVTMLSGVFKTSSAISALRATTRDMQTRLSGETYHLKPLFLSETGIIATQLGRLPKTEARETLISEFIGHKDAMLAPDGVFSRLAELLALGGQKEHLAALAESLLQGVIRDTENMTQDAVSEFRTLAVQNRAATQAARRIDLMVTSLAWVGGVAIFWTLIERNLFRRVETLVQRARSLASGEFGNAVSKQAPDEVGELEMSMERLRTLSLSLSSTHAKLSTLLDQAPSGIVTANEHGLIETANAAMEQMFLLKSHSLIGRHLDELFPSIIDDDNALGVSPFIECQSSKSDRPVNREFIGHRKNDERFELDLSMRWVEASGGASVIAVFRDVTEKKAAEAKLREAHAELQRSNHDLDNFAYAASHDLKAPLRAISNISGWIVDDLGENPDAGIVQNFALMRGRIRRMERLLDDLLTYSRLGRVHEESDVVTGAALVHEVVGLCDVPPGFEIRADRAMRELDVETMPLKNILLNLVSNAIKHHDRDRGCIVISAEPGVGQVLFEVADDGPGIEPQFHQKVLQMFETLKPRDQVEGSGMGLAMVKRQVELCGGQIEIVSGEGRGTAFRFSLEMSCGKVRRRGAA